jgi:hypothetical protein
MDSFLVKIYLTGSSRFIFAHRFPEESDENQSAFGRTTMSSIEKKVF